MGSWMSVVFNGVFMPGDGMLCYLMMVLREIRIVIVIVSVTANLITV